MKCERNIDFFLLKKLIYFHNILSALADKLLLDFNRTTYTDNKILKKLILDINK